MDINLPLESGYQKSRPRGMPAFVCFKGGGTPDPSPEEIAQRERAAMDWERWNEAYAPLEKDAIEASGKFSSALRSKLISGKGNADVAQQEQDMLAQTAEGLRSTGASIGSLRARAAIGAQWQPPSGRAASGSR